jgi:hypothetical protein
MAECHLRAPPGRDRRTRDRHLHCRLPHSSRHRCRGTLRGRGTDGHPVLPPAGHFAGRRRVHWPHDVELFLSAEDAIDTAINITAIGATTFLALQSQPSETALREQASLLDLTHDSIVAAASTTTLSPIGIAALRNCTAGSAPKRWAGSAPNSGRPLSLCRSTRSRPSWCASGDGRASLSITNAMAHPSW